MTGPAVADHLALMARSGLMTHVAELDPPVTAASMEQFRADAAAQASNVMALSSGTFAVCLSPNVRSVATSVPHRLHPIALAPEHGDHAAPATKGEVCPASHNAPRRILPPSLRRADPAGHAPPTLPPSAAPPPAGEAPPYLPVYEGEGDTPGRVPEAAAPTPAPASAAPAPASAPLERLAHRLDLLEQRIERQSLDNAAALQELEHRLAAQLDAQVAPLASRIGDALATGISHLAEQIARAKADGDAAAQTREGRARARLDSLEARLAEAFALADAERTGAVAAVQDLLQNLTLAQAEQETRTGESLTTLRLGLRAVNDRLSEVTALLSDAPAQRPAPAPRPIPEEDRVTVLHAAAAPSEPPERDPEDGARERRLRTALAALLDELGQAAADPGAGEIASRRAKRRRAAPNDR